MFQKFFRVLTDILFPRRCPVCDGAVAPFGSLICEDCVSKLEFIQDRYCLKCGKGLEQEEEEYCSDCSRHPHMYNSGRALFVYKSVADSLYRFKYKGRQEYADYYADAIAEKLGDYIRHCNPDAIVPVPIHASKRKSRGYNQAELIAKCLSDRMKIPIYTDLIVRCKKTVPLKDLTPLERQNNLKKAFKILRDDVKLKTIVIIDDIYTTGNTIDAMSIELRRLGIEKIYFVTLAVGRGC